MRPPWIVLCGVLVVGMPAARAEEAAAEAPPEAVAEDEALPPHKAGPLVVDLGDGVEIDLPAGMILFERAEARSQVEARGDDASGTLAIVIQPGADWELDIDLVGIGYVSDGDADKLDAGELLRVIEDGNREQNRVRAAKGVSELSVTGWSKPPGYDRARRMLTWALDLSAEGEHFLNDLTNVLGRRGYVSATLIASTESIATARVEAAATIRAIRFQPGHRYEDFDPAVDQDSGLGLRELIAGGGAFAVASKLGIVAKILLALKKFFILIGAAIAGIAKWILVRRKRSAAPAE